MTPDVFPAIGPDRFAQFAALRRRGGPQLIAGTWEVCAYDDVHRILRSTAWRMPAGSTDAPTEIDSVIRLHGPQHARTRSWLSRYTRVAVSDNSRAVVAAEVKRLVRQADWPLDPQLFCSVPAVLTSAILGVSLDAELCRHWGVQAAQSPAATSDMRRPNARGGGGEPSLDDFIRVLATLPRSSRAGRFAAAIRDAAASGALTSSEASSVLLTLVLAAGQAVYESILSVLYAFAVHLDRTFRAADSAARRAFITETLRLYTPSQYVLRQADADCVIAGAHVEGGGVARLWLAAANRDPAVFDEPDDFVLTRPRARNLSFARGEHGCIAETYTYLLLDGIVEHFAGEVGRVGLLGQVGWTDSDLAFSPIGFRLQRDVDSPYILR